MRGGPATLLLELQQQLISLVLHVLCVLKAPAELRGTLRLSWTSTLITCTGWQVSCSLEFRSSATGSYTVSSQVRIRSNRSLQFWNPSGPCLIRLFLSNIRQKAVVGDPPTISAPMCSAKSCARHRGLPTHILHLVDNLLYIGCSANSFLLKNLDMPRISYLLLFVHAIFFLC